MGQPHKINSTRPLLFHFFIYRYKKILSPFLYQMKSVFPSGLKRGRFPEKWRSYSLPCLSSCVLSSAGSLLLHSGGDNMISPRDFHYLCKYKCISSYIRGGGVGTEKNLTDNNFTFCFTFSLQNCHTGRRKADRCEPGGVGCEPAERWGIVLLANCVAGRQNWAFSDGGQTASHLQAWEYLPAEGAFSSAVIKELNASFITIITATY